MAVPRSGAIIPGPRQSTPSLGARQESQSLVHTSLVPSTGSAAAPWSWSHQWLLQGDLHKLSAGADVVKQLYQIKLGAPTVFQALPWIMEAKQALLLL